jgi:ParB-like chromosome segregation protein Spo0J
MIQKVNINNIFSNPVNPRSINNIKFKKLVKSIKEFPEMLKLRPIVVNKEMGILGGNMRYKACQEIGLKEVYIIKADNLTNKQIEQFIIKDNVGFGEWDWDILANNWDITELKDWGMDVPKFDVDVDAQDFSNNINESYRIEIELENEDEQEKLYNELINKGYICRLLTL